MADLKKIAKTGTPVLAAYIICYLILITSVELTFITVYLIGLFTVGKWVHKWIKMIGELINERINRNSKSRSKKEDTKEN